MRGPNVLKRGNKSAQHLWSIALAYQATLYCADQAETLTPLRYQDFG